MSALSVILWLVVGLIWLAVAAWLHNTHSQTTEQRDWPVTLAVCVWPLMLAGFLIYDAAEWLWRKVRS